ncbi:MAG: hypothetical protein A3E01_02795 [Gammaproteobacteria bacterium RIFCSPHIGHO2_12_FULL_63_22]|nr:MAG: hypothetical protein A3E01_02795 [Gammaproteobacteria bacterium RIFCSPHIGHO2_12_FULL_63_22]
MVTAEPNSNGSERKPTCGNCRFWQPVYNENAKFINANVDSKLGECRATSPQMFVLLEGRNPGRRDHDEPDSMYRNGMIAAQIGEPLVSFPVVPSHCWCGCHEFGESKIKEQPPRCVGRHRWDRCGKCKRCGATQADTVQEASGNAVGAK